MAFSNKSFLSNEEQKRFFNEHPEEYEKAGYQSYDNNHIKQRHKDAGFDVGPMSYLDMDATGDLQAAQMQWKMDQMQKDARASEKDDYISRGFNKLSVAGQGNIANVDAMRQSAMQAMQQKLGAMDKYLGGSNLASVANAAMAQVANQATIGAMDQNRQNALSGIQMRQADRRAQDQFNAGMLRQSFEAQASANEKQKALYDAHMAKIQAGDIDISDPILQDISAKTAAGILSPEEEQALWKQQTDKRREHAWSAAMDQWQTEHPGEKYDYAASYDEVNNPKNYK
jgi:hypothetical protein